MGIPHLLERFYRRETLCFYRHSAGRPRAFSAAPPAGYVLSRHERFEDVPAAVASIVMPGRFFDLMRSRLERKAATLFTLTTNDGELAAYGWTQSWTPFRRHFGAIASEGRMLGYYKTFPAHRRRGLYGHLLRASLATLGADEEAIIFATANNEASLRVIESVGFEYVTHLETRRFLHFFSRSAVKPKLAPG